MYCSCVISAAKIWLVHLEWLASCERDNLSNTIETAGFCLTLHLLPPLDPLFLKPEGMLRVIDWQATKLCDNYSWNTCLNDIFTCPKKKRVIFDSLLKVVCPLYTFSSPDSGNCYFLIFQNACPNTCNTVHDFYLPQAIGQVLKNAAQKTFYKCHIKNKYD